MNVWVHLVVVRCLTIIRHGRGHLIYTILMAFQDSLIGRHVSAHASAEERREELTKFVAPAIKRLLNPIS